MTAIVIDIIGRTAAPTRARTATRSGSLITLKALTYAPTGGWWPRATTSLPEEIGGVRNWDYRYCWLRDATLHASGPDLAGYVDGGRGVARLAAHARSPAIPARCRSCTASPVSVGSTEYELDWLPGYEGRRRCASATPPTEQFQLDVYGEVMDASTRPRRQGSADRRGPGRCSGRDGLRRALGEPDDGIWEVRGPRRHFTHSRVMAWVAFDRAVRPSSRSASRVRSRGGRSCVTRSTPRSATTATIRPRRSPSPTARRSSTPACS